MLEQLDQLAAEMFRTFARFEYALKAAGYHKGNGAAEPNWRSFAESIPGAFDGPADTPLGEAVRYILEHPPKKQVVAGGNLDWSEEAPQTDLQSDRVLIYVRRVRNNLFHGGKFNGRWFEPQRSEILLRHSLTILRACLDASDDVRQAFNSQVARRRRRPSLFTLLKGKSFSARPAGSGKPALALRARAPALTAATQALGPCG